MADKALTLKVKQLQAAVLAPRTKQAYATGCKRYAELFAKVILSLHSRQPNKPYATLQLTSAV